MEAVFTGYDFMHQLKIRDKNRSCWLNDDKKQSPSKDDYTYNTYISLMTLCIVTVLILGYINYRVIKIVKTKDKVLVAMLVCLKLSLMWDAIFFGFEASAEQGFICFGRYSYCMSTVAIFWPGLLLGIALILTFNKWVSFTMTLFTVKLQREIDTNASDALSQYKGLSQKSKIARHLNNAFAIFVSVALTGLGLTYSFRGCSSQYHGELKEYDYDENVGGPIYRSLSIIYLTFACLFLIIGIMFWYLVRQHHP
jgi:ABC-type Fe3+ transport system permease subunit